MTGKRQCGAALLLLMVLVVMTVSVVALNMAGKMTSQRNEQKQLLDDQAVLTEAKQALLVYAARRATQAVCPVAGDLVMLLPCPNTDPGDHDGDHGDHDDDNVINGSYEDDGSCVIPAGSEVAIGRLPLDDLDLSHLRDSANEVPWYAVSNYFGQCDGFDLVTPDLGELTTNGKAGVIAVVFAPGPALVDQVRSYPMTYMLSDYLDGSSSDGDDRENRNGDSVFAVDGVPDEQQNDRMMALTVSYFRLAVAKIITSSPQ